MENPEPTTPAEAASRLVELQKSSEWTDKWLAGSGPHLDEFRRLTELANTADKIGLAIAGADEPGVMFQSREHRDNIATAATLRDSGVHEEAIARQVLSGEPVSRAEHNEARIAKDRLLADTDFTKRYLAGDSEARRQMTLLEVVLTRDIKEESAA